MDVETAQREFDRIFFQAWKVFFTNSVKFPLSGFNIHWRSNIIISCISCSEGVQLKTENLKDGDPLDDSFVALAIEAGISQDVYDKMAPAFNKLKDNCQPLLLERQRNRQEGLRLSNFLF
jgi:hypothetical protein